MNFGSARYLVGLIIVVALGAATFRISTAPERMRQRHEQARQTCVDSGGRWVRVGRDEVCDKESAAR